MRNNAGHDWPIYYEDTVHVGNEDSGTAIICLWTKKEQIKDQLESQHYALLGQLYSQSYGIEILCRNLLANNQIRYLVVTGIDLNDVSPGLINLFEYGLQDDQTITGTDIKVSDDLAEYVDELRDRVHLVDERRTNDFDDVNKTLRSLPPKPSEGREIILDLPDVVQPTRFPTDFSGFAVRGRSFEESWHQLLRRILLFGVFNPEDAELRAVNMAMHCIDKTEEDEALLDATENTAVTPSETTIDGDTHHMIQRDRVEAWTELRSLLRGVKPPVTVSVQEAYLDEDDIKKAIEAAAPRHKHDRNPDPNGNILIRVQDGEVRLLHCNQKGEVIDEYASDDKRDLFHHLESYYKISLIGHALDIGAEIQKAITALNNDTVQYEQDTPLHIPTQTEDLKQE